jgi:eukaryotic-like serine/threonine-protein kinase
MGEYEFVVSDGSGRTQTRAFPGPRFIVGSGPDCQMRFDGVGLLSEHAEVAVDQRGQPWVRDLTGRTLVWVNGEATKHSMIPEGSLLRIGALELVVRQRMPTGVGGSAVRRSAMSRGESFAAPFVTDSTLKRPTPFAISRAPADEPPPEAEMPPDGPDDSTVRGSLLQAGTIIDDRYRVVRKLAAGGMGEVYRADHVELGKPMAVKVMLPELSRDPEFVARFKREAIAASRIGQQNIVDISDFGRTKDGRFYFVMEYLDGLTLASVIHRGGCMVVERAAAVSVQVARALAAAHALGIVHRDLKPENVMLLQRPGQSDFVKVLDFGVAKVAAGHGQGGHTAVGMVVGTPQYMSPEQAKAIPVDARSDIYSLGLIIYELITGRPTFTGETPSILMVKHVTERPPPFHPGPLEEVPGELEELVYQMLEKDVDARPQTMEEVVKRLDSLEAKLKAGAPLRPRSMATPSVSGVAVRVSGGHKSVMSSGTRNSAVMSGAHELDGDLGESQQYAAIQRSKLPLVLGLVALLLIAGGGLYFLIGTGPSSVAEPTQPPPPRVTAQPDLPPPLTKKKKDQPTPQAPPPPAKLTLHVRTVPDGVGVYENGAWIGQAPLDLTKEQDTELELKFALAGYKSKVKKVKFLSADPLLMVELEKEGGAAPPRHPRPRRQDISGNPYESDPGSDLKPLPE